jgi:branched-subunit amino acid transport protein
MTPWVAVVIGSVMVFSWKFLGYLLPAKYLESKWLTRLSGYLTIALLSGLVGAQTFTSGNKIEFDARIPALVVAAILLKLKAPFIVVVVIAAATAALLRLAL